ncbi:thermonuclease family protein [Microbacterium jejuense]|uniref:thermonuclease family protein n=1 Tax=Microbacterium jejuense TaxID=1263637 RepID=UPI0031E9118F
MDEHRWLRRAKVFIAVGFVLFLAVLAVVAWPPEQGPAPDRDWGLVAPRPGRLPQLPTPSTGPSAPAAGIPSRPDDAIALTVTYVFDGDTIEAVDPGTDERTRVRLIGIDTPEGTPTPECWAGEARAHLSELLPEGATVWASPDAELRDRYDRALLYLWTDDGRFVNYELMAAGDAEALRIAPNTAHAELFAAAQAEAEASQAGRWGAC